MMVQSNKEILSQHFPAWKHLSESDQAGMLENTARLHYPKGMVIHGGESDCIGVLLIQSGTLRTYMLSEEGREITLYRMGRGDWCILSASCILTAINFDVYIDAEEDTEVLLIGSPFFVRLQERNVYVECFSYKLAAERFSDVMWAMQQILFMSMDKRLAVFLWDELSRTEGDTIRMTHEQIAKYMGSAREVVSRMLKYFAEESIVALSRGGIKILNKEKLRVLTK